MSLGELRKQYERIFAIVEERDARCNELEAEVARLREALAHANPLIAAEVARQNTQERKVDDIVAEAEDFNERVEDATAKFREATPAVVAALGKQIDESALKSIQACQHPLVNKAPGEPAECATCHAEVTSNATRETK